jgi:hypothetical protein
MPDLFEAIAEGKSLRQACVDQGLDPPSTHRFIEADDRLRQQYAHARAVRGDALGTKVAEIAQLALDGEVAPDVARAAMDGFKWTAGRMAPKRWGDKVAHEHTGSDGGPIQTYDLSKLPKEKLQALEALLVTAAGGEAAGDE